MYLSYTGFHSLGKGALIPSLAMNSMSFSADGSNPRILQYSKISACVVKSETRPLISVPYEQDGI